ncbi:MAG: hypothetical protein E7314_00635 [Clostridiales bacterium]|nr:hypothetical protein [Clostridiales bacterium]
MARIKKKKVRTEEEEHERWCFIGVVIVACLIVVGVAACIIVSILKQDEPLPPYEEQIVTYEVVSVYKYVRNETNIWGGVTDTDICYNFSYISNGNLYHIEDFIHYDYGLTKVIVGTSDCYIVNKYTDERYLQLTKETLRSLTGTSE